MADQVDLYSDLASFVVNQNGMTLIFLRSIPVPAGTPPERAPQGDFQIKSEDGAQMLGFEIVARIRMTPTFVVELINLLTKSLERITTEDHVETSPDVDPPVPASGT
jgi:hypothetical protein